MAGVFMPSVDAEEAGGGSSLRAITKARELRPTWRGARGEPTSAELEELLEATLKKDELYLLRVDGHKLDALDEGPHCVATVQPDYRGLSDAAGERARPSRQGLVQSSRRDKPMRPRSVPGRHTLSSPSEACRLMTSWFSRVASGGTAGCLKKHRAAECKRLKSDAVLRNDPCVHFQKCCQCAAVT